MLKLYSIFAFIIFFMPGFIDSSFAKQEIFEKKDLGKVAESKRASGEIIVKFKEGVSEDEIREINNTHGSTVLSVSKRGKFRRIRIPNNKDIDEMVESYSKNPNVEYAEQNSIAYAFMTPNDPYFDPYQWNLDNPVYGGINVQSAWEIQTGDANVIVAVIDTGVAYENYDKYALAPDLSNTTFVAGYDFVNDDSHANDDHGHGTHVTGTIAQSTNNAEGTAGIAFHTSIMPIKVLNRNGSGFVSAIADGIYFAADNGASVINLSLGSTSPSQTEEDALAYAYNKGVTIFCAAGNEYESGNPITYPAAYDAFCIAAGATRYDETRSYYSNTGSYLDIAAPGGDITVDQNSDGYGDGVLQQTINQTNKRATDFGYWFFQGTSMASPHAAGVAALLIANNVNGPDKIRDALQSTAKDKGNNGRDDEFGWGIIDAAAALAYTPEPIHDIAITYISAPATLVQGESTSIVVTASNPGDFTESINITLTDNTDAVEIGNQSTSLSAGQTMELTFNWATTDTTSIGNHILLAEASNITGETNTDNNIMSATVSIQSPLHDVAVIALDAPLEATTGDLVSVSITVKNLGTYAETTIVTLTDTTGNTLIDSQTISALEAGASNILTFSWDTTGISIGDHTLLAETSVVAGEENTSDNAMSTITTVNEVQTGHMHISDIVMYLQSKGKNYSAIASITIVDEYGNPVNGATVTGDWNFNNNYLNSVSGTTDDTGSATLKSNQKKAQSANTFTITITNVEKTGYTYDLSSNTLTSASISVP